VIEGNHAVLNHHYLCRYFIGEINVKGFALSWIDLHGNFHTFLSGLITLKGTPTKGDANWGYDPLLPFSFSRGHRSPISVAAGNRPGLIPLPWRLNPVNDD